MRSRVSTAAVVVTAVCSIAFLTEGCSETAAGPMVPTAATSAAATPTATPDYPSCSTIVYPSQQAPRAIIAPGSCVSLGHFGDIAAVITRVDVADPSLFTELDALTYRATRTGRTVLTVATKREICTATATCQVPNPPKHVSVVVRRSA